MIQCDQAVPSCGQCIRTKRKCPGYRNAMDLMFFDQTKEAAKRSKRQSHQDLDRSRSLTPLAKRKIERAVSQPTLSNVVICQSLDDLATNYFMRIYVGSDPNPAQFGFVSEIYSKDGNESLELQQSLKAVGLAGYAKVSQRPDLLMTATGSYVAAVQEINHKLSTASLGNAENALLTSVVLLAMFEIMVLPSEEGHRNFSRHIRGALSLAVMLLEQNKHVDHKILQTIFYCVLGESWVGNKGFPPEFFTLYRELGTDKHPDSVNAVMIELLVENLNFRLAVESGQLSLPRDIMAEALRIHRRTRHFFSAPNMGRYNHVFVPPPFGEPMHDAPFYGMMSCI